MLLTIVTLFVLALLSLPAGYVSVRIAMGLQEPFINRLRKRFDRVPLMDLDIPEKARCLVSAPEAKEATVEWELWFEQAPLYVQRVGGIGAMLMVFGIALSLFLKGYTWLIIGYIYLLVIAVNCVSIGGWYLRREYHRRGKLFLVFDYIGEFIKIRHTWWGILTGEPPFVTAKEFNPADARGFDVATDPEDIDPTVSTGFLRERQIMHRVIQKGIAALKLFVFIADVRQIMWLNDPAAIKERVKMAKGAIKEEDTLVSSAGRLTSELELQATPATRFTVNKEIASIKENLARIKGSKRHINLLKDFYGGNNPIPVVVTPDTDQDTLWSVDDSVDPANLTS